VTVVGRSPVPARSLPRGTRYLSGDYGDQNLIKNLLSQTDELIDFAYATVPQTSFADPLFDLQANLPPSVSMLRNACEFTLRRVVLVSSGGTVYGVARSLPIDEEHPTNPISPYGITKLTIEKYGLMFHRLRGLPVIIVRPANAFGPGQIPEAGQGFVATAMGRVLKSREITIYGKKGTVRDYVFISDVVRGICSALEHGELGSCYNIGTGIGKSNLDVLERIEPLVSARGLRLAVRAEEPRGFDVPVNILDSTKLTAISGWRPSVPLDQGIEETWNFIAREAA
jgi:UDP-glucose 4-epimerase